jgi:hypothetical protein
MKSERLRFLAFNLIFNKEFEGIAEVQNAGRPTPLRIFEMLSNAFAIGIHAFTTTTQFKSFRNESKAATLESGFYAGLSAATYEKFTHARILNIGKRTNISMQSWSRIRLSSTGVRRNICAKFLCFHLQARPDDLDAFFTPR